MTKKINYGLMPAMALPLAFGACGLEDDIKDELDLDSNADLLVGDWEVITIDGDRLDEEDEYGEYVGGA